ncbi:MAG TPA: CBS domain-containing protein [Allosphingosinicella sp.]|jgi:CBS domain-containing protein
MTIAAILKSKGTEVLTVGGDTLVSEALGVLADRKIGAVPVVKNGQVVGIMSERDIIYRLRSDGAAMLDWTVDRIMTAPAITVTPDSEIMSALALMTKRRIRHLPVVEGEALIGLVSIGDLVKHRMDRIEADAAAMLTYIQSV